MPNQQFTYQALGINEREWHDASYWLMRHTRQMWNTGRVVDTAKLALLIFQEFPTHVARGLCIDLTYFLEKLHDTYLEGRIIGIETNPPTIEREVLRKALGMVN